MSDERKLKQAEQETEINISPEKKISGDYKKGSVEIKGFNIKIENPKGSIRSGTDAKGVAWSNEIKNTYGYIENTIGNDGDELDVFLGDFLDSDYDVYLITQQDPDTKEFDEHKIMLGFQNVDNAIEGYFQNYAKGWDGLQSIKRMNLQDFKAWVSLKETLPKQSPMMKFANKLTLDNYLEGRVKNVCIEGEIIEKESLQKLQLETGSIDDFDTLVVTIASQGGSVCEGISIMLWFNSLIEQRKNVVTIVTANAYSIASLIMLAANFRIISDSADVMVHNPMLPEIKFANAGELEAHAKGLRELEELMITMYKIFTGIDENIIRELMNKETYLTPEDSVKYGFVDEIVPMKKRPKAVGVNNNKKTEMNEFKNILTKAIAKTQGLKAVNQVYYTESGDELEITQKDMAQYSIGDKVNKESGVEKLSDGAVVTIEGYEIKDIDRSGAAQANEGGDPATDAPNTMPPPTETPEAKAKAKAALEEQEAAAKAKAAEVDPNKPATDAPVTEAARAEFVKEIEFEEQEAAKARVAKRVAELTPKTEETAPAATNLPATEVAAENPVTREEFDAVVVMLGELKTQLDGLKTQNSSELESNKEFQALASKAIDSLATSTTSGFTPEAKGRMQAPAYEGGSGSIWQRALAEKAALSGK